ncbi:hypothetical protein H5203_22160 [Pseudoalteromonas sp. SG41-1]|uniref:hypothetical protein n=1 Tax=Pseudoalteromonas sp. SG41-1 TaxID=2760979 RepID=UPI0016033E7C|nr:hypothetical protein [Pseudoalteromonas sp. SG41-1]MBB1508142.1 hypothetical protein [Pseudoalteromonas sp. SG41-1]
MKSKSILLSIITALLLTAIIIPTYSLIYSYYLYTPNNSFVVFNKEGALFEEVDTNLMYRNKEQITQWLQDAVREMFTYNYLNADKNVGDIKEFEVLKNQIAQYINDLTKDEENVKKIYGKEFGEYQSKINYIKRETALSRYFSNHAYERFRSDFFDLAINGDLKESKGKVLNEIITPLAISNEGSYQGRKAISYEGSIVLQKHSIEGISSIRLNISITIARVSLYAKSEGWEIVLMRMEER